MLRFCLITALLLLALVSTEAQGQLFGRWGRPSRPAARRSTSSRDCWSGYCKMCAKNYGLLPGYAWGRDGNIHYVGNRPAKPSEQSPPTGPDSTPQAVVDVMLVLANLTANDVLLDPGCGDGRFLSTAVSRYHCRAVGIEIDGATADRTESAIKAAGVADQVLIIRGDARKIRLDAVTAVVLYMFPKDIEAMRANWPNARVVLSYLHEIPSVENQKLNLSVEGQEHTVYFWVKERL